MFYRCPGLDRKAPTNKKLEKAQGEGYYHTFDHSFGIDNARRLHCEQTDERIHAQQGYSSKFIMKM
jgi:hypothetical protein